MSGGGPPPGPVPHVLVGDIADRITLDADADHHLRRVRRTRPGDPVTVTDGRGRWAEGVCADEVVERTGPVIEVTAPVPPVTIAFALTKGDAPEDLVTRLTELGVDRIVPFQADRSVVRWDEARRRRNVERMRAAAVAALQQSHGVRLPEIAEITDTAGVAALGAVRCDLSGAWPSLAHSVLAVGPEGGWSDGERALLPQSVQLGPNVLRTGTAAVTAGGVICSLRADLVRERPKN